MGVGDYQVGSIYLSDGDMQAQLWVRNIAQLFNDALVRGLNDAGLAAVPLDSNPEDGKPPEGSDFILNSTLQRVEVNKRFSSNWTIHGQYFTMKSLVLVKCDLNNRDGATLYSHEISGIETEPPVPVGGEVFLPLETQPAESLSVAMSRAVGLLMIDPNFREHLPIRSAAMRH
jgi:hypothetical protein